jgi:hypothetical protein
MGYRGIFAEAYDSLFDDWPRFLRWPLVLPAALASLLLEAYTRFSHPLVFMLHGWFIEHSRHVRVADFLASTMLLGGLFLFGILGLWFADLATVAVWHLLHEHRSNPLRDGLALAFSVTPRYVLAVCVWAATYAGWLVGVVAGTVAALTAFQAGGALLVALGIALSLATVYAAWRTFLALLNSQYISAVVVYSKLGGLSAVREASRIRRGRTFVTFLIFISEPIINVLPDLINRTADTSLALFIQFLVGGLCLSLTSIVGAKVYELATGYGESSVPAVLVAANVAV